MSLLRPYKPEIHFIQINRGCTGFQTRIAIMGMDRATRELTFEIQRRHRDPFFTNNAIARVRRLIGTFTTSAPNNPRPDQSPPGSEMVEITAKRPLITARPPNASAAICNPIATFIPVNHTFGVKLTQLSPKRKARGGVACYP